MPYTAQTWTDGDPATPLNAARLGVMEAGIAAAHTMAIVRATGVSATDTTAIQAAITANPGKRIWVDGDVTLNATITISTHRTRLVGTGTWTAGFTGGPMVRVQNCDYVECGDGIFFDGNWQSGVSALELRGALLGAFRVRGDRLPLGINVDCANAAATQNSALNELWLMVRNGLRGIVFTGKSGQHASNNRVRLIDWWGATTAVSVGMDFAAYADNNYTDRAYLNLGFAGSTGVVVNSQSPASDVEVYENHGDFIVEATTTGCVALDGNRTWQTVGTWPTFMRLRTSGSSTPTVDRAANSDIVLINSNLNGTVVRE